MSHTSASSSDGPASAAASSSGGSVGQIRPPPPPLVETVAAAASARAPSPMQPMEAPGDAPALSGVRQTAEYRAAWDLELWKAIQAERFRVELEKQKALAVAALKRSIDEKEKRLRADLRTRAEACTAREAKLAADEAALTQRHAKLQSMEADLRRMRQQLLDAQARVEEEVRAQVRRANDDIAHKAKLLQERVAAAEAQAKRAEERQKLDQTEYLNLYQEFSKLRVGQLSAPSRAADSADGAASPAQHASLAFYLEQVQQLRAQHAEDLRLAQERLTHRHEAQLHASHQHCRELEAQNSRLTAALARRREQLHQKAARPLVQGPASPCAPASALPAPPSTPATAPPAAARHATAGLSLSVAELVRELSRLRHQRDTLLSDSAGALQPGDKVMQRIDARIAELEAHLAARLEQEASADSNSEVAAVAVPVR